MSLRDFKNFFLENVLDFLWAQWSALGVSGGGVQSEDKWIIDPEATLVFSLEMARYDPRVFDEILDWLVVNGQWVDISRLRGILKEASETTKRLTSAVANYVSQEAPTYKRKWNALASLYKAMPETPTLLFLTRDGKPHPPPKTDHHIFLNYGFRREVFVLRKMTRPVSVAKTSNLRFLLRALFGLGSRAECIAYLLTHEAGHPSEVAREIGLSTRGAQDALIELSESGLVLTRGAGKRKIEYWLSRKRWLQFITGVNLDEGAAATEWGNTFVWHNTPVWLNWISLYSALLSVWNVLNEVAETKSDYMRSSKLREVMETISVEFLKSGLDLPSVPGPGVGPDRYEQEFQTFITKVLGARQTWPKSLV